MKKLILPFAALAVIACSDKKKDAIETAEPKNAITSSLDDAKWLIGKWQNVSDEGTLTETWMKESDSSYSAKTFFITGKDTAFSEFVRLVERNGNLVYIAQAAGQNDEKPVEFALTALEGGNFIFENPKHDYPNKIVYENYGDSIKARISGNKLGVESKEEFPMKKVK
ncbi:DUF6265 family protein [Flavobacterium selenitireducens]|uniref:DUF6265 family protein n=1 Tax=Flavobacterium selenitireducens TaxID=2722704 RepID=UPI00168B3E63|nr:DUF6265 family protein [Flavobacterium selenitireducens]MBD3583972.1 hypothetical protein [Flavobacterium selenitireducens]